MREQKERKGKGNTIKKQNDSRFHTVWQAFQCVTNGKGRQQSGRERAREKAKQCEQDSCCMCVHILKLCKKRVKCVCYMLFVFRFPRILFGCIQFPFLSAPSLSLSLACCFTQIVLYGLNTPLAYAMITKNQAVTGGRNDDWSACCR